MRAPITFFVMMGAGLNWKERAFVTAAWSPKATVQAALANAPAVLIMKAHKGPPYPQYGQDIFVTAVFAIIICASVGVILVNVLTPLCLTKVRAHLRCRAMPHLELCLSVLGHDCAWLNQTTTCRFAV